MSYRIGHKIHTTRCQDIEQDIEQGVKRSSKAMQGCASHMQVHRSRSQITKVTSRAVVKALVIEATKGARVVKQDKSNVDEKQYK